LFPTISHPASFVPALADEFFPGEYGGCGGIAPMQGQHLWSCEFDHFVDWGLFSKNCHHRQTVMPFWRGEGWGSEPALHQCIYEVLHCCG